MFDANAIATVVKEVQAVGDQILEVVDVVEPGVALPAELAEKILDLSGEMLTKALTAWQAASGQPITAESIAALMPSTQTLDAPTA